MFDILTATEQAFSLNDPYVIRQTIETIRELQRGWRDTTLARSRVSERLLITRIEQLNGSLTSTADILVLIRQIARYFGSFELSTALWKSFNSDLDRFSLSIASEENGAVRLIAQDWSPNWLSNAQDMDALFKRRDHNLVPADGTLYNMMKPIASYQSEGQRQAVQAVLFGQPGTTTLVTLPTGAGKSLCTYLPAWVASAGGKSKGGTTLVIVPTVALAIDQYESSRRYFTNSDPLYLPYYIAGDISKNTRALIRQGIQQGSIPLLFISPESLIGSEFSGVFLDAAKEGRLTQVVVDEAHLVETWGVLFRADFQLLPTYFRALHEASPDGLKILLLSATISRPAYETLEQLFTLPGGQFIHAQVNQLRPEIGYWMAQVPYNERASYTPYDHKLVQLPKMVLIAEALRHLPRPAILYLTSPDDAEDWYEYLKTEGYQRIATFTGSTAAQDRLERIRKWRENQIDLMIATSAFGLGVDKPDVRTIIHATFPESIDRFYQEVGRGGRDGCSSISLLLAAKNDLDFADSNASKSRITPEIAWDRWQSMFETSQRNDTHRIINRHITRQHNMRLSERNQSWNDHVLLLMQRAAVIRIDHLTVEEIEKPEDYMKVEVLNLDAVNTEQGFRDAFEPVRNQELNSLRDSAKHFVETFQAQVSGSTKCLAEAFEQVYSPVGLSCGGCPACRKAHRVPYQHNSELDITSPEPSSQVKKPGKLIHNFAGYQDTLQLIAESFDELTQNIVLLTTTLIKLGVVQIILPNDLFEAQVMQLVIGLEPQAYRPHLLLKHGEVGQRVIYDVPTACFIGKSTPQTDKLYQRLAKWQTKRQNFLVYVLPRTLELASLQGSFMNRVSGHQSSIKHFLAWHRTQQHTL